MNNNFTFKIYKKLEDKLEKDWLNLEENSKFFFFKNTTMSKI